jgi:hypothetical protein
MSTMQQLRLIFCMFLCFLGSAMATAISVEVTQEELAEAEKHVIKSRLRFDHGTFAWTVRRPVYQSSPSVEKDRVKTTLYLKNGQTRQDSIFIKPGIETTFVWIDKQSYVIRAHGNSGFLSDIAKNSIDRAGIDNSIVHIRKFGVVISGIDSLQSSTLEEELLSTRRTNIVASVDNSGGANDWIVTYEWPGQAGACKCKYILDRETHLMPKQMSVQWIDGGVGYEDCIKTTWSQTSTDGLWFPKQLVFTRLKDGIGNIEEIVDVSEVDLADPMDALFDFEGMGLEKGQKILVDDEVYYWNENGLSKQRPMDRTQVPFTRRYVFLFVAMVLSIIGVIACLRRQNSV